MSLESDRIYFEPILIQMISFLQCLNPWVGEDIQNWLFRLSEQDYSDYDAREMHKKEKSPITFVPDDGSGKVQVFICIVLIWFYFILFIFDLIWFNLISFNLN